MGILAGIVLAVFCIAVVLCPFLRRGQLGYSHAATDAMEEPQDWKTTLYQSIHTLRLEYDLGSLGEEEYQETFDKVARILPTLETTDD